MIFIHHTRDIGLHTTRYLTSCPSPFTPRQYINHLAKEVYTLNTYTQYSQNIFMISFNAFMVQTTISVNATQISARIWINRTFIPPREKMTATDQCSNSIYLTLLHPLASGASVNTRLGPWAPWVIWASAITLCDPPADSPSASRYLAIFRQSVFALRTSCLALWA